MNSFDVNKYLSECRYGYEMTFTYKNGNKTVLSARKNCATYESADYSGKSMTKNELLNNKNLLSVTYNVVEFN